jgi:hypothetical protein
MAVKADDVLHPDEIQDDFDWAAVAQQGEHPDESTHSTLTLAHRALAKFPELSGRYKAYAGAAVVVSSVATLMAAIAIARKTRRGMSADRALAALTVADIEAAAHVAARDQRYKRLLRKIVRQRRGGASNAA